MSHTVVNRSPPVITHSPITRFGVDQLCTRRLGYDGYDEVRVSVYLWYARFGLVMHLGLGNGEMGLSGYLWYQTL